MNAADFKVGDRVEMRNPNFPDKRPSRHVVTKHVPGAGEHGDQVMLELDHSMGAPPDWCAKARTVYPSTDVRDIASLMRAIEDLEKIVSLAATAKETGNYPRQFKRLAASSKVSAALLREVLAGIPGSETSA